MNHPPRVPGPRRLLRCFGREPQAVPGETPPEPEPEPEDAGEETRVALPPGEPQELEECPLCLLPQPPEAFPSLASCSHRSCRACLQRYLRLAVRESRVPASCPHCPAPLHPSDVQRLLPEPALRDKYEEFLLRRLLVADPGTRWCPAPDCRYRGVGMGVGVGPLPQQQQQQRVPVSCEPLPGWDPHGFVLGWVCVQSWCGCRGWCPWLGWMLCEPWMLSRVGC